MPGFSPSHDRVRTVARHVTPCSVSSCAGKILIRKVLVANRGEIAIRICQAARELGIRTVAVYTGADAESLHVRCADESVLLSSQAGYLNIKAIVDAARDTGADAVHPGYGFLSEEPSFVRSCEDVGLVFIGPTADVVELFGDKAAAKRFASSLGVPIPRGSEFSVESPQEVLQAIESSGVQFPIILKAISGGGGRGIRVVFDKDAIPRAFDACTAEAKSATGHQDVYFEEMLTSSRHIEVQVFGDACGNYVHLFERDCSAQFRRQKVLEMAPAPRLSDDVRSRLHQYALLLAQGCKYRGAGTFEFLVQGNRVVFIEGNPRIQVEHTVTEEAVGIDLVQLQLRVASGFTLHDIGLHQRHLKVTSFSMQARIYMTRGGFIGAYQEPAGRGIRVESCCYSGYRPPQAYDPLLAKIVASTPMPQDQQGGFEAARIRLRGALLDLHVGGTVEINLGQLMALLEAPEFVKQEITTSFLDQAGFESVTVPVAGRARLLDGAANNVGAELRADRTNQLDHDNNPTAPSDGQILQLRSPCHAQVVGIKVEVGEFIRAGQEVATVISMKMEHVITSAHGGVIQEVRVREGDGVNEGDSLVLIQVDSGEPTAPLGKAEDSASSEGKIRADLAEVLERRRKTTDAWRLEHDAGFVEKLARRHSRGSRSARENIAALCDADSFVELGRLLIAQQRRRRSLENLIEKTPGDGLVAGFGSVNSALFGKSRARIAVASYDYTVLAGTQGLANHMKCDRLVQLATEQRVPMVWFCEGGGGRPGDTDGGGMLGAGLVTPLWANLSRLSALVPLVGLTAGRCFAGNAAVLGCCDVVIAVEGSNIGMGGPAMIEGGGLGKVLPEQIGPISVQRANGVVDIVEQTETEAVEVAKKYLGYFQGPLPSEFGGECADQQRLRHLVPENRLRVYDMRPIIQTVVDTGSLLELRREYGVGIISGLARIDGRPLGILANNPLHLGGAVDGDAALKASRFMKLCDAFGLPIVAFCDTPGFMVGIPSEANAAVRKVCSMFVTGASLSVPYITVVTRRAYGLGGQAMAGGAFMGKHGLCLAWPTGEFGPMGLEGAVHLGFRKELDKAFADGAENGKAARKILFEKILKDLHERGKAVNNAMTFELDDVIDPAETRDVVLKSLEQIPREVPKTWQRRRPCVDTW